MPLKYAISLGTLNPKAWAEVAVAADELGFDAVFASDHLVLPQRLTGLLRGKETIPPSTPLLDATGYLSYLAGLTKRVRLGTYVYLLGLRHPFITARAFATLDIVSSGRAWLGVGAGWIDSEWQALGLDPGTRGTRLNESMHVCRRLWSEEIVSHEGEHFAFEPVYFQPKPVQKPIPIIVGGEAPAALRRAALLGDGWAGMAHTPESAAAQIATIKQLRDKAELDNPFEITVMSQDPEGGNPQDWLDAGVDRLVICPWTSSREAVARLQAFAERVGLGS